MKIKLFPLLLSLVLVASFAPLFGQVGKISGTVSDPDGNPLQDVEVTIEGMDVKRSYTLKTNKDGKFVHAGVPLQASYRVVVKKDGYKSDYVQGVRPSYGDDQGHVEFTMQLGQAGTLAFELSDEDIERIKRQNEQAEKQREAFAAVQATFRAGVEAYNAGDFDSALASFKEASEKDAKQPAVWANLGNTYQKLGRIPEGIDAYEKAVALNEEDAALFQNLGNLYAEGGDTAKAQESYERAARISAVMDPKAAAGTYYNLGVTHINAGRNQEAVEALTKAVEADPDYSEAYYQLGITQLGLNQIEEAVKNLKKYIQLVPEGTNAETAKALVESLG